MKISYNWLNIIQNNWLPPICILCGHKGIKNLDLCGVCYRHLPNNQPCCQRCAETLAEPNKDATGCDRCQQGNPAFDRIYAPFLYLGAIRYLITSLKFSGHYKNARLLGHLLADYLQTNAQRPDMIIPIPLHKSRYHERGFNQSIEIARTISQQLQIPLDVSSCIRYRNTPHQTTLTAEQRRQNMKNAFSLTRPLPAQHVAILDDVITTGSTVHELSSLLKNAGVRQVDVWACARA